MTDGNQTYESLPFYIEVIEVIEEGIYPYLEKDITSQQYDVQIGEETSIELGKYIGNGTTVNSL